MCTVLIQTTKLPASSEDPSAIHQSQTSFLWKHHLHSAHTLIHASHSTSLLPKYTHVVNKAYSSSHSQNNTGLAIWKKIHRHSSQNITLLIYCALTIRVKHYNKIKDVPTDRMYLINWEKASLRYY